MYSGKGLWMRLSCSTPPGNTLAARACIALLVGCFFAKSSWIFVPVFSAVFAMSVLPQLWSDWGLRRPVPRGAANVARGGGVVKEAHWVRHCRGGSRTAPTDDPRGKGRC